jgi:outer membrane murein-binding lipoprotein Lpp
MDRANLLLASAFGAALLLTSCTCKIKEEQQAMINQLRTSEKQLSADIQKAEGDKTKILAEVTSRQGEVRRCNEKKAFVQDKMARWPDVWPDWNPNQPAPAMPMDQQPPKKR